MRIILFILLAITLTACEDRFRYPCQDPENWETKQCKKPYCSANGTCPEDLRHYEKNKADIPAPPIQNSCTVCKPGDKK